MTIVQLPTMGEGGAKYMDDIVLQAGEPNAFGRKLGDFRIRKGLSKRKMARIVDKNVGTYARIEDGTMKPPRDAEFYHRLKDVLTDAEIDELLHTGGAPPVAIVTQGTPEGDAYKISYRNNQETSVDVHVGGMRMTVTLDASANPAIFSEEEVRAAMEAVKVDVEWCLRDLFRRQARLRERAKD